MRGSLTSIFLKDATPMIRFEQRKGQEQKRRKAILLQLLFLRVFQFRNFL